MGGILHLLQRRQYVGHRFRISHGDEISLSFREASVLGTELISRRMKERELPISFPLDLQIFNIFLEHSPILIDMEKIVFNLSITEN